MIVTIIGSLTRASEMLKIKSHFENLGCDVNSPTDTELQSKPLLEIQKEYITKIQEADLIAVVPKFESLLGIPGKSNFSFEIGESTSYELAIAYQFGKKVVFV